MHLNYNIVVLNAAAVLAFSPSVCGKIRIVIRKLLTTSCGFLIPSDELIHQHPPASCHHFSTERPHHQIDYECSPPESKSMLKFTSDMASTFPFIPPKTTLNMPIPHRHQAQNGTGRYVHPSNVLPNNGHRTLSLSERAKSKA